MKIRMLRRAIANGEWKDEGAVIEVASEEAARLLREGTAITELPTVSRTTKRSGDADGDK